jgi:uncharacterized protein GlcG (DUF336 family)
MKLTCQTVIALVGTAIGSTVSVADTLLTHRIPAALAVEAASETVSDCAKQGYRESVVLLDADGATIISLRGDGAGIHTLDSAHDKAYTSVSFKTDTTALAERAKGESSIAPLSKLPHVMFFGGGISLSLETKRLVQLAQPVRRAPSWMTIARRPGWRKFEIV